MERGLPNFSEPQWRFLSVLEAFREPVHVDVVGALVPMETGSLLEILQRGEKLGWLIKSDGYCFRLAPDLPPAVMEKLERANDPDTLAGILGQLKNLSLLDKLSPDTLVHLLSAAGKDGETARLRIELAHKALKNGKPELIIQYLKQASPWTYFIQMSPEKDSGFLSIIRYVLAKTGGKVSGPGGAAKMVGLKRTTLHSRMKKLGMR